MVETLSKILPYVVLLSHFVLVVIFVAILARRSWGKNIARWVNDKAVLLSFLVALAALVGSLLYSEGIGYEPCTLCWWIRIFLYPQVVVFGIALFRGQKGREVFPYMLPLTIGALLISLYFSYFSIGGVSLFPCTAEGSGCDRVFVKEFGYVTIPMMSFTVALFLAIFSWVNRLYKNEYR